MADDHPRLTWIRAGDRYSDLRDDPDHFLALDADGEMIGVVKLVPSPAGKEWMWSMLATHPGPAFRMPTNGRCETRREAARELVACYTAFRAWFGIED
jgi:hypothetical protein